MIALHGVCKRFGPVTALAPLDLCIDAGQTCALIGSSGSGKSTLLRVLLHLVAPDSGRIEICGERLDARSCGRIRQRIGYLAQDGGLFPHLCARRNAALMAAQLGWPQPRIAQRVAELARLVSLPASALDRFPAELSGGQRQRVGLMRALMLDPAVLLLDEPLAALDPLVRVGLQAELREIFRSLHKTVVLVTHDLAEAAYLADRILLLRGGRLIQDGTLQEFVDKPAEPFVTAFVNAQRGALAARPGSAPR